MFEFCFFMFISELLCLQGIQFLFRIGRVRVIRGLSYRDLTVFFKDIIIVNNQCNERGKSRGVFKCLAYMKESNQILFTE